MSKEETRIAQEVTDNSHVDEDRLSTKESKKQMCNECATPVAEVFSSKSTNLSDNGSKDYKQITSSSKPSSTQVEDLPVLGDLEKAPPVPPRSKKRRVVELKCCEVRWFHRKRGSETKWTAFKGIILFSLYKVAWLIYNKTESACKV